MLRYVALKLRQVSIDYLLDDGEEAHKHVIREAIDLEAYGDGRKKKKKDRRGAKYDIGDFVYIHAGPIVDK